MEWPELVHVSEIQSRLLHDGMPVERAMKVTSEIGPLRHGDRYRIERAQGDLYLYAQGAGYYRVASG
jgi:hypothetical protein